MTQYYYSQPKDPNKRFKIKPVNYKINTTSTPLGIDYEEPKEKRSVVSRFFDAINIGQYTVAGFARGFTSDEYNPLTGALTGAYQSISALNPFSKGNDDWKHSFTDVLDESGWKPKNIGGKVGRFAVGTALDIFLDPMTYVSGGTTALLRGTGKHSVNTALDIANVVDKSSDIAKIADATKGVGMSLDMATEIVSNSKLFKNGDIGENLLEESTKFMNRYNNLLGVNTKASDVTLSLANAPFGKKIFGKSANKSKVLFTSDTMKELGDKTFAPIYAEVRHKFFGAKIGQMIGSTKAGAYAMHRSKPGQVFDFFKEIDMRNGIDANKIAIEASIMKNGMEMLNLTPAENKQVIELLEDKNTFTKIKKVITYAQTEDGKVYNNMYKQARELNKKKIDNAINFLDNLEDTSVLKSDIDGIKSQIDTVRKQFAEEFISINEKYAVTNGMYEKVNKASKTIDESIIKPVIEKEQIVKEFDEFISKSKQKITDIETRKELASTLNPEVTITPGKLVSDGGMGYDVSDFKVDMKYEDIENLIPIPESMKKARYKNGLKQLDEKGYIFYSKGKKAHAEDFLNQVNTDGSWQMIYNETLKGYQLMHNKVSKGYDVASKVSTIEPEFYSTIIKIDKEKVVNNISEYVFGQKGMLDTNTYESNLTKIVDMVKNGEDKEAIADYIFRNKDNYSGKANVIYSYVGNQMGYGSGKEYKTWKEFNTDRLEALLKKEYQYNHSKNKYDELQKTINEFKESNKVKPKVKITDTKQSVPVVDKKVVDSGLEKLKKSMKENILTEQDKIDILQYRSDKIRRKIIIDTFKDTKTVQDVEDILSNISNMNFEKDYDEIINMIKTTNEAKMNKSIDLVELGRSNRDINNVARTGTRDSKLQNIKPSLTYTDRMNIIEKYSDELLKGNNKAKVIKTKESAMNEKISTILDDLLRGKVVRNEVKDYKSIEDLYTDITTMSKKKFLKSTPVGDDYAIVKSLAEAYHNNKLKAGSRVYDDLYASIASKDAGIPLAQYKTFDRYAGHVNDLLQNKYKKAFSDLSKEQLEEILLEARKMDDAISNAKWSKFDNVASKPKTTTKIKPKKVKSLDDIDDATDMYNAFFKRKEDVSTIIDDLVEETIDVDVHYSGKIAELSDKYNKVINDLQSNLEELESKASINTNVNVIEKMKELKKLQENDNLYIEALKSADNFENFIRTHTSVGNAGVDKTLSEANAHLGEYVLDPKITVSDKVRDMAVMLREQFYEAGVKELEIGKLTQGQFDEMMDRYIPHILTPEGRKFFDGLAKNSADDTIQIKNFGAEFGFGREFSPHSKSRTIKKILLDGEWIENPNINQINEYFKPMVNGKNVFADSIADIYVARMIKHSELLYDDKYMNNMIKVFGSEFKEGVEGFENVSNYGKLKESSRGYASKNVTLDISDMITNHISSDEVQHTINTRLSILRDRSLIGKFDEELAKDDIIKDIIEQFKKKKITPEFRQDLFKQHLDDFLDISGTRKDIDEISKPFTVMTKKKIGSINKLNSDLKIKYEGYLNKHFARIYKINGKVVQGLYEFDDMYSMAKNIVNNPINNKQFEQAKKFLGIHKEFKSITDIEVGSIQKSIIDNVNMARELQLVKDNNRFLDLFDKVTHFIKLNQTTVTPDFHVRNKISDTFVTWLDTGIDAINPKLQKGSLESILSKGKHSEEAFTVGDKTYKWSELFEEASKRNVMDGNMFANELGVTSSGKGLFNGKIPGKFDPTNTQDFGLYKAGTKVGSTIENQDRFLHFAIRVKQGMGFDEASEMVDKLLFDYGDLTFFEKNVMKRIIPYYTWMKKNSMLQLEMVLDNSDKYRYLSKVLGGVDGMIDYEDRIDKRYVNDFAQDWIQLPLNVTNPDGRKEPVLLNPSLPFGDLNNFSGLLNPVDGVKDLFNKVNPLLKVPIEQATNKQVFFDSPIVQKGDNQITKRIDHVLSQLSLYGVGRGMVQKSGLDRELHTLNTVSGIKLLSYDYEKFKQLKISQIKQDEWKKERLQRKVSKFGNSVVNGFEGMVSLASNVIESGIDGIADIAYKGRPTRPDEYTDALRPISEAKYLRLDKEEKKLYTPPTQGEAMYYNNKAIELEKKVLEETGASKKFIWTLLEDAGLGKRNEKYEFGEVTHVRDGDTFDINIGGKSEGVRLLLVDSPETQKNNFDGSIKSESMPYGDEAEKFTKKALIHKDVKIFFDGDDKRDKYNRLLAYVEVDGEDFNNQLLEAGMAQTGYVISPPYNRLKEYSNTENKANVASKGIWSLEGYAYPNNDASYDKSIEVSNQSNFKRMKLNEIMNKRNKINAKLR